MCNRPKKIREIFSELRTSLDSSFSSRDILLLASEILKSRNEKKLDVSHREYAGNKALYEKDLTSAMSDGGWRILSYEMDRLSEIYDDCDPVGLSSAAPFGSLSIKQSVFGV